MTHSSSFLADKEGGTEGRERVEEGTVPKSNGEIFTRRSNFKDHTDDAERLS